MISYFSFHASEELGRFADEIKELGSHGSLGRHADPGCRLETVDDALSTKVAG